MRSPRRWAHSPAALTLVALAGSISACAALWGFQDGVPLREGGADAEDEPLAMDATAIDGASSDGAIADANANDASIADAIGASPDGDRDVDADDGGASWDGPDDVDVASVCPGACLPYPVDPGWQGPFAAFEVTDGGAPPACASASFTEAFDLFAAPDAAQATCDCRCEPPANVTCSAPQAVFSSDRACTMACAASPRVAIGACTPVPPPSAQCTVNARVSVAPGTPDGGSCVPIPGADASPIAWAAEARLCAPVATAGACAAGVCVPPPGPVPNPPTYCVVHTGAWPCPAAYPAPHAYGDGGTPYIGDAGDSRGCTCSCGAPTGLACGMHVALFDSGTCSGAGVTLEAGACMAPAMDFASGVSTPLDAGSCAPFGIPTGGLALTDSYTICCTQ